MTSTLGVIVNTFAQSLFSATLTLLLAGLATIGLMSFRQYPKWIEPILILPAFLPPLYLVSAGLNFYPLQGLGAVVVMHSFMNLGFVAVAIKNLISTHLGQSLELAFLEGATSKQLLKTIFLVFKKDLTYLWALIFLVSFTSYTVPTIFGFETLELLIASTLRISIPTAWNFAAIEITALLFLSYFLSRLNYSTAKTIPVNLKLFCFPFLSIVALIPILFLIIGLLIPFTLTPRGFNQFPLFGFVRSSVELGLVTGGGVLFLSCVIALFLPYQRVQTFILTLHFPSAALIALLAINLELDVFLKTAIGLILLLTPFVFKWIVFSHGVGLRNQWSNARLLGASNIQIFKKITAPQLLPSLFRAAGLASLFGCSDFSISAILSDSEWTLPVAIQNLLSLYRLDLATLLMLILIAISMCCYFLFLGIGYGIHKKFKS